MNIANLFLKKIYFFHWKTRTRFKDILQTRILFAEIGKKRIKCTIKKLILIL